ncbi:MAG: hypothetical protein KatS3mg074_359 [Meiothermus sp.]|nr:MAG: hypothetical protein KatS3mg074_359 [Meiothermus sp.]
MQNLSRVACKLRKDAYARGTMSTHTFEPTHYHHTLGSHPPALKIAPGDTVITTCVDAGGLDRYLQQVTPGAIP